MARRFSERLIAASDGPVEPQAPETPRTTRSSDGIDRLARHLRDDLNVQIILRDHTFSPAREGTSLGNRLYSFITHLYWQSPGVLDRIIEDFEADCIGYLIAESGEDRSKALHDVLKDHSRMVRDSLQQSPLTFTVESLPKTARPNRAIGISDDAPIKFKLSKSVGNTAATLRNKASNSSMKAPASSSSTESFGWQSRSSNVSRASGTTAMTSFEASAARKPVRERVHEHIPPSYACSQVTIDVLDSFGREQLEVADAGGDTEPDSGGEDDRPPKRRRSHEGDVRLEDTAKQERTPPETPPAIQKDQNRHHQITKLPASGFGADPYTLSYENEDFAAAVERARLVQHCSVRSATVKHLRQQSEVKSFLAKRRDMPFHHSTSAIWAKPVSDEQKFTLSGAIRLNSKSNTDPLFQLTLHPIKIEKSCRMQRHYGWHRHLYVTVPSINQNLPPHLNGQRDKLHSAFMEWLLTPHRLMGRTWRAVDVEQLEPKRQANGKKAIDCNKAMHVIFFATHGKGLEEVPVQVYMDWMVPFEANRDQRLCKAVSRFDLMFSATTPTIQFRPDQVRLGKGLIGIPDVPADGEDEDTSFDDTSEIFANMPRKQFDKGEPMTDGCALISPGAAMVVCERLGITSRPSVFQARINGAKGTWYVAEPYEGADPDDIRIEIRQSQLKVFIRAEDLDPTRCEPDRWSFDVVSYSHAARPSEVHRDFMQILEDRGVPREVLIQMVLSGLKLRAQEMKSGIHDPAALVLWRSKKFGRYEDIAIDDSREMPKDSVLKTHIFLDKAGYLPAECPILANAVERMFEMDLQDARSQIRAPCIKSTILVGIADPSGTLKPGEVYVSLSLPLEDETTGDSFLEFIGQDILVARHPTLRGSDMQKVRAVYRPELSHLKDVIVMSVQGRMPLAAKLQGGDYDGDKFWICADDRLTAPFRNLPVFAQNGLNHFGIKQDKKKYGGIVSEDMRGSAEHADLILTEKFRFNLQPNILGTITNSYYKRSGAANSLWTPAGIAMADAHDLYIDAPKNGLSWTEQDLEVYLRKQGYPSLKTVPTMAYLDNIESMDTSFGENKTKLLDVVRKKYNKKKGRIHILDDLLFNTINPVIEETLDVLSKALAPARDLGEDADLQFTLTQLKRMTKSFSDAQLLAEEKHVLLAIDKVFRKYWMHIWSDNSLPDPERTARWIACREQWAAIEPLEPRNERWDDQSAPLDPILFERFKVAVLSKAANYRKRQSFMFHMARPAVCYMKSNSPSGRETIERIMEVKRPKKPKGGLQPWGMLPEVTTTAALEDEGADEEFGSSLDVAFIDGME